MTCDNCGLRFGGIQAHAQHLDAQGACIKPELLPEQGLRLNYQVWVVNGIPRVHRAITAAVTR